MFEPEPDEDAPEKFKSRMGIDDDQFSKVATFFSIMTHQEEVIVARPEELHVTRAELEDYRSRVLDMFLTVSKAIDRETIEANGALDTTLSEEGGVGVFSHERMTRAAIRVFEDMDIVEVAVRAGVAPAAVECLHDIITRKLLYMSAEAVKLHPEWNALDILKALGELETFADLNDLAVPHLDEDDKEAVAREAEEEAE